MFGAGPKPGWEVIRRQSLDATHLPGGAKVSCIQLLHVCHPYADMGGTCSYNQGGDLSGPCF